MFKPAVKKKQKKNNFILPVPHLTLSIALLHQLLHWGWAAAAAAAVVLCCPSSCFAKIFCPKYLMLGTRELLNRVPQQTFCSVSSPAVFNSPWCMSQPCGYDDPPLENEDYNSSQLTSSQHVCCKMVQLFREDLKWSPYFTRSKGRGTVYLWKEVVLTFLHYSYRVQLDRGL